MSTDIRERRVLRERDQPLPGSRLVHIARVPDVPADALLKGDAEHMCKGAANRRSPRIAPACSRHCEILARAASKITDAPLLNLIVDLAEGMARLPKSPR